MRAPLKRWLALAGVVVVSTSALAWTFSHFHHTEKTEDRSVRLNRAVNPGTESSNRTELIDSDNDGIPDAMELRTFQDRDSFRRWFTAIAETQFYQLSDQWNAEQRDCAGLARFAIREALRHHDRIWFQKMGPAYQTVAPDVKSFDLDHNSFGEKIFRTDFGSFRRNRHSQRPVFRIRRRSHAEEFQRRVRQSRSARSSARGSSLLLPTMGPEVSVSRDDLFWAGAYCNNGAQDWVVYHTGSSPSTKEREEGRAFSARSHPIRAGGR
jgi:uncharacterized protein YfaT (DUF1175 family)